MISLFFFGATLLRHHRSLCVCEWERNGLHAHRNNLPMPLNLISVHFERRNDRCKGKTLQMNPDEKKISATQRITRVYINMYRKYPWPIVIITLKKKRNHNDKYDVEVEKQFGVFVVPFCAKRRFCIFYGRIFSLWFPFVMIHTPNCSRFRAWSCIIWHKVLCVHAWTFISTNCDVWKKYRSWKFLPPVREILYFLFMTLEKKCN